jgi:hypothetical protein
MNRWICRLGIAATAGLLATACGSAAPSYYMASNSSSVLLIEWAAPQGGQATGTITYDSATGSAPDETLDVQTVPVKVTFNGSQVTFTFTGLAEFLGGGSLTGTTTGGSLDIWKPASHPRPRPRCTVRRTGRPLRVPGSPGLHPRKRPRHGPGVFPSPRTLRQRPRGRGCLPSPGAAPS